MRVADLVVCESCRISCGNTVFWVLQSYGKERVNKLLNINSNVKGITLSAEDNSIKPLDYFEKLPSKLLGRSIADAEACKLKDEEEYLINSLNECSYVSLQGSNNKYDNSNWKIPYQSNWSDKYINENVGFLFKVDDKGISEDLPADLIYSKINQPVYTQVNSPMTVNSRNLKIVEEGYRNEGKHQTVYYNKAYKLEFKTNKTLQSESVNFERYYEEVEKWKNVNYKSTTDPGFQHSENITNLAKAILANGELNPIKVLNLNDNKLYSDGIAYYNAEELSYRLFGYVANKYFNFAQVMFGQAFAIQYLNSKNYNPTAANVIYDAPWLIKAFNNGWAEVNGYDAGFAPSMYTEYGIDGGVLTDGFGVADMIEVTLWIYAGTGVEKLTVKVGRDMLISAYINWQVQIVIRMLCGIPYEEAVKNIDYQRVAWNALTSVVENNNIVTGLNCIKAGLNEFERSKQLNLTTGVDMGIACLIEIVKDKVIQKLISDSNGPYGKFLYENLKKRNHSKSELLRTICIVFNCHSDVALEMMRFIPTEAINALVDDLDLISRSLKTN